MVLGMPAHRSQPSRLESLFQAEQRTVADLRTRVSKITNSLETKTNESLKDQLQAVSLKEKKAKRMMRGPGTRI